MNREIKFRAWYPKYKTMYPVKGYMWEEEGVNEENLEKYGYDERILMQYTGLKDKNGKEIYEGDIISVRMKGSILLFAVEDYISSVCFKNGSWQFQRVDGKENFESRINFRNPEELEIIGNIFENPELLDD